MNNDKTSIPLGKMTIVATEALPAHRFVNYNGGLCGPADAILGVTDRSWAQGELAAICFAGVVPVELNDGIFNVGTQIASAANGLADTAAETNTGIYNLDAGQAGQYIRVKL